MVRLKPMVFELRSAAEAPFVPLLILTVNTAVVNPIVIKERIITTAMNDIVPIIVSSLLSAVICNV